MSSFMEKNMRLMIIIALFIVLIILVYKYRVEPFEGEIDIDDI